MYGVKQLPEPFNSYPCQCFKLAKVKCRCFPDVSYKLLSNFKYLENKIIILEHYAQMARTVSKEKLLVKHKPVELPRCFPCKKGAYENISY